MFSRWEFNWHTTVALDEKLSAGLVRSTPTHDNHSLRLALRIVHVHSCDGQVLVCKGRRAAHDPFYLLWSIRPEKEGNIIQPGLRQCATWTLCGLDPRCYPFVLKLAGKTFQGGS